MGFFKKLLFTIILAVLTIGVFIFSSGIQYSNLKDNGRLQSHLTKKLVQVGGVWATVKVVSGVISVLETIQVEGSIPVVGGAAVSVEPLGWTAVVDNTLDYISNICLWAMGAIIIEKILLAVSLWLTLKIIIPLCLILLILAMWNKNYEGQLKKISLGLVIIFGAICLAVPLSLEMSVLIENSILNNYIDETIGDLNNSSKEAEKAGNDASSNSLLDMLKRIGSGIAGFFERIKNTFDRFIESMINYIMCFLLTNILIPIGTIIGLKYLISAFLSYIGFRRNTAVAPVS